MAIDQKEKNSDRPTDVKTGGRMYDRSDERTYTQADGRVYNIGSNTKSLLPGLGFLIKLA